MTIKNKVIIWGADDYNPLGLFRQVQGYAEIVFIRDGRSKLCASKSKYCKILHKTNSLEEGMKCLLDNYSNEQYKPFLITSSDLIAEFVDQHKFQLEQFFYITGTKEPGLLTRVLDKNLMCQMAQRIGFDVPASRECKWDSNIDDVSFPCLLKPDKNRVDHQKEFKTKICYSREELESTLKAVEKDSVFVLQDYINKVADALIYGCRTHSGVVVIAGVNVKTRWDSGGNGSFGYISGVIPETIKVDLIEKYLKEIDYTGLFSVEYALTQNKAFFLEFNLRNDGTSHYFYQAGVDIPMIWILDTLGMDYSEFPQRIEGKKVFMADYDDLSNVWDGKLSFKEWLKNKKEVEIYRFYDKDDKKPYYYGCIITLLRPLRSWILTMLGKRHKIG
jgi:predicted ATP-grasp superfamily ATP-dependent carboligase